MSTFNQPYAASDRYGQESSMAHGSSYSRGVDSRGTMDIDTRGTVDGQFGDDVLDSGERLASADAEDREGLSDDG